MKLEILDKIVDVEIPKQYTKYNLDTIKALYSEGVFDDVDKIEQFDHIGGKYCSDQHFQTYDVENIGIWISGGADSSILLYLLAKEIKDNNLNINIQPLSVRRGRPWNPLYAARVIDFIVDDLSFSNMNEHIIYYPDINDEYQREHKEFREKDMYNFNNRIVDIMYSGITCNPPSNDTSIPKNKERSRDEESERPIVNKSEIAYYINPFFSINKKYIAEIYKKFNLVDTLFPLTRSCEGLAKDSGNYTYHCGKCWWCKERIWAFGKLE